MKLGIVGLPNVGKSTLFNAITNAGVPADNYAFCTIDPNVGVVSVPDERLDWLSQLHKPKKTTPAVIEFVDIAGLVKGASKGEGLGNKFLSNIRTTDAMLSAALRTATSTTWKAPQTRCGISTSSIWSWSCRTSKWWSAASTRRRRP